MNCPQCQQQNPTGAKFCNGCGSRLELVCQACSHTNPPESRFCNDCGAPLTPAADKVGDTRQPSPETYTPKHLAEKILTSKSALEGERKQVTVLFADLKGSMELLADRDPEESRTLLNAIVERMMEAVHRYEGTVNNVMGDGIMAIFGAPLAHEDHALRACYAGLAMQESIRAYSNEVRRSYGIEIQIRAGLNSGEVVVGDIGNDLHMDYNAVGQTTHLAARMEQLALPGSIRLTVDTLRLVEGFVQVNPLGPVPVKGVAEPVEVFELVGAEATRKRLQTAMTRGLTQFVGRQGELEILGQALEKAHTGSGQVVAIVGEPGVGKSRLFWEFTHSHRMGDWLILQSGSVSYGKATPYLPVTELLKAYFQIEEQDDLRKIRERLTGKLLTLDEGLRTTLPALFTLTDVPVQDSQWQVLDPTQRREKILDALKTLFLRESQVQPLCLVFEDLHWIDSETQSFLDNLVESMPATQVLLLVNYRPEYQHSWGNKTYYSQLRVDPLPPDSADELLHVTVGHNTETTSLRSFLIERTQGNPFFLEESVRGLVETGVLSGERGDYRLAKPIESITVPATVQAILAARIDRLAPEEKRLLQTAAVLGKDVPFALLQAIVEEPDDNLRRSLTRLQATEFLYETQLFPDLAYTFKHALTHEVAYGTLLHERRKILHARIVEAIERLHPDELHEQVEALAHHAYEGQLWAKAGTYLHQAGIKVRSRSAYREASAYFNEALGALAHLPESDETLRKAIDIRVELGTILMATKGPGAPEVQSVYRDAHNLCEQVGETPQLFPVLWGLSLNMVAAGNLQAGHDMAKHLLPLALGLKDNALLLEAHHTLWTISARLGELASARAHLEKGRELYDPQEHGQLAFRYSHDPGACCRWHAGTVLWLLGYPDQALVHSNDGLRLAREQSHLGTLAMALTSAVCLHQYRRDQRAAEKLVEELSELAIKHGLASYTAHGRFMQGWLMTARGKGREGITLMQQNSRSVGRHWTHLASLLSDAYCKEGQITEGLSQVNDMLTKVNNTGHRDFEAELLRIKGDLLLQQAVAGKRQAEACFHEAIDVSRRQGAKSLELRAIMSLSRLLRQQGKEGEARQLLTEIYNWFTEGFDTADLKEAKALLEELS